MSIKANSNGVQSEGDGNIKVLVDRPICGGEESGSPTLPNGGAGNQKRYVVRLVQFADSNTLSVGISRQWWKPTTTTAVNKCGGDCGEWLPAKRGGHLFMPVNVWHSLVTNIDDVNREIQYHVLQNNGNHHGPANIDGQQQCYENDVGRGCVLGGNVSATTAATAASSNSNANDVLGPTRGSARNDEFGAARGFDGPTTVSKRNATAAATFYGKASPSSSFSSRYAPSVYNTAGSGPAAPDISGPAVDGSPASKFGRYNAAFVGGRCNGGGGYRD